MPKCHRVHWWRESQSIKTESPNQFQEQEKTITQTQKKKSIKGKPYLHAEKAGGGNIKRANEDQTSRTQTQDDWKRKSQAFFEKKPQKFRQANKKTVHVPWWKTSWRSKESHWSCGKEAPKRDNSDGGGRRRGRACVRARASERENREKGRCGCSRVLT